MRVISDGEFVPAKVCRVCREEKSLQDFTPRKGGGDGREHRCRKCKTLQRADAIRQLKESDPGEYERRILAPARARMSARLAQVKAAGGRPVDLSKKWRQENREAWLKAKRLWREKKAEQSGRVLATRLPEDERRLDRETKAKGLAMRALIRARRKRAAPPRLTRQERARRDYHRRMAADPCFGINIRMRVAIGKALKGKKAGRKWELLVGYTSEDLEAHLERQLPRGYSMRDFANGKLHIDHIIPKSMFDVTVPGELRACWALSNLRPLPAKVNLKKGARRDRLL